MNPYFLPMAASNTRGPRESMTTLINKRNGPKLPSGLQSGSKALRQPDFPHFGLRHGDIIGDSATNDRLSISIKQCICGMRIAVTRLPDAAGVDQQAANVQIDRLAFG